MLAVTIYTLAIIMYMVDFRAQINFQNISLDTICNPSLITNIIGSGIFLPSYNTTN